MITTELGSAVELITKTLVRFTGTLVLIETTTNCHYVHLTGAKNFGSEGRKGEGREIDAPAVTESPLIMNLLFVKEFTVTAEPEQNELQKTIITEAQEFKESSISSC
jgi:hypothetical protein